MFKLQSNVLAKLSIGIDQIADQGARLWAQNLVRSIVQILCNSKQSLAHDGAIALTGALTVDGVSVVTKNASGFVDGSVYIAKTPTSAPSSVPSPYKPTLSVIEWTGATEQETGESVTVINSAGVSTASTAPGVSNLVVTVYRASLSKFELVAVGASV